MRDEVRETLEASLTNLMEASEYLAVCAPFDEIKLGRFYEIRSTAPFANAETARRDIEGFKGFVQNEPVKDGISNWERVRWTLQSGMAKRISEYQGMLLKARPDAETAAFLASVLARNLKIAAEMDRSANAERSRQK